MPVGRAFLHRLGAMGEEGVRIAFEILRKELDVSIVLTGVLDAHNVSRAVLLAPRRSPI